MWHNIYPCNEDGSQFWGEKYAYEKHQFIFIHADVKGSVSIEKIKIRKLNMQGISKIVIADDFSSGTQSIFWTAVIFSLLRGCKHSWFFQQKHYLLSGLLSFFFVARILGQTRMIFHTS